MLSRLKTRNPSQRSWDVQFNILILFEHVENFVWATPNNIQIFFVWLFSY